LKKWYKSKIIWFNVAIAMGAAVEASLNIIEGYFDPRIYFGLVVLIAGVNVLLRCISTSGLYK
jgi:hypothetical protein